MSRRAIEEVIKAASQERKRIEDPKNRSRYFMHGVVEATGTAEGCRAVFADVPDRVLQDAQWLGGRGKACLFKIGDAFVEGMLRLAPRGVEALFPAAQITRWGLDAAEVSDYCDNGIYYVMDSRELMDHLCQFLAARAGQENRFALALTGETPPGAGGVRGVSVRCPGLNDSQRAAIRHALSHEATFLWGPPGTGKTLTMAALAARLVEAGKRVLLTALSNTALDQLFLTTVGRLGGAPLEVSAARMGSRMDENASPFSRQAFAGSDFGARKRGMRWSQHVADAQLVAANFAMLCYPGRAEPGEFDYAIADEVSMANIPSLVAASFFAKHGLVLGGDPHQLPPIYPEDAEEPNEYFRDNVFQKAGVEDPNDARAAFLDTQYRMQKEIGDLVSRMFYGGVLKTATRRCSGAAACGTRVAFIHSPGAVKTRRVSQADTDDDARFNDVHAESAASAVALLLAKGVGPADVGVIAPYNAQVVQIHRRVREASDVYGVRTDGVKVSTVHRFQGQERRAMVVDFTDDNVKPTRLTSNRHLVNVALSRAKEQLVIIGNSEYLVSTEYFSADKVDMFKQLLEGCQILEWPQ